MTDAPQDARPGWGRFAPLAIFLGLAALMGAYLLASGYFGYSRDALPSALIGRAAPVTELPALEEGRPPFDIAALTAPGPKVVNIWASWCVPCRVEHPFLMAIADLGVPVLGINYRDDPANARAFLAELGDPFAVVGVDRTGRAGVEWGVYGVPETFVVDGEGRVIYKHVGPIQSVDMENRILPALRDAGWNGAAG
jgi:cytochrome c biogenesis protein CcmG/thiol:disulfide interchange protein DsbE